MWVTDKVYLIEAARGANAYLVRLPKKDVLIDSGRPDVQDALWAELCGLGVTPQSLSALYLTHSDFDHMGNAAFLQDKTGCEIYLGAAELPYARFEIPRPSPKDEKSRAAGLRVPRAMLGYMSSVMGPFTVIPTPGHTPAHAALLLDNEVMFIGDLCVEQGGKLGGPNPIFTADMEQSLGSLRSLKDYPFTVVCPAHAAPCTREELMAVIK